ARFYGLFESSGEVIDIGCAVSPLVRGLVDMPIAVIRVGHETIIGVGDAGQIASGVELKRSLSTCWIGNSLQFAVSVGQRRYKTHWISYRSKSIATIIMKDSIVVS